MEEGINLTRFYAVLKKRWRLFSAIVLLFTLGAWVNSLTKTDIYSSEVLILPSGGGASQGGMNALSVLMGSGLPVLSGGGGSSATTKLLTLLESRMLSERLVTRLDLKKVFYKDLWDEKENRWKELDPQKQPTTESAVDRLQGMIHAKDIVSKAALSVAVESDDPKQAAFLANEVVAELQRYLSDHTLTEAKKNRVFTGQRLIEIREEFLEAGKELASYYEKNRISATYPQVDVDVSLPDMEKESLSMGPLTASNGSNIDHQVDSLVDQKQKTDAVLKSISLVEGVPQQIYLEYLTMKREILGKLNAFLSQQYETARIDETRDDIAFEILDDARVSHAPFKPDRKFIVSVGFFSGLLVAFFVIFFSEYVKDLRDYL